MDHVKFFKDLVESIPDYRKSVFSWFLIKNDDDLLRQCGYVKHDINRQCLECKNILMQQNEEYLIILKTKKTLIWKRF